MAHPRSSLPEHAVLSDGEGSVSALSDEAKGRQYNTAPADTTPRNTPFSSARNTGTLSVGGPPPTHTVPRMPSSTFRLISAESDSTVEAHPFPRPLPDFSEPRPTPPPVDSHQTSAFTSSSKRHSSEISNLHVMKQQSVRSAKSGPGSDKQRTRLGLTALPSLRSPRTPKVLRSPASASSIPSFTGLDSSQTTPRSQTDSPRVNFHMDNIESEARMERSDTFFGFNGNYEGNVPASRNAIGDPYMNHCASTAPAYIGMASHDLTIGMAKIEQSVKNWQELNSFKYKVQMQATHRCILDPHGRFRVIWDIVAFVLIAYQIFLIPIEYAFDASMAYPFNTWWWIEILNGLFFLSDFVLNCITAYIKVDGIVIRSQRKILEHYFLYPPFYAALDLASLTPFALSLLQLQSDETTGEDDSVALTRVSKTGKFLRALKLLKLLRIIRAVSFARRWSTQYVRGTRFVTAATRLINLFLAFVFIAHFGACSWRVLTNDFELQADMVGIDAQDLWQGYVLSAYWAISTLASAEPPTNPSGIGDMIIWSFMSIISVASVSLAVGALVQIFDSLNEETKEFNIKMQVAQRFLTEHNLAPAIKAKVLQAVQTSHEEQQSRGNFQTLVEPLLSQDLLHQLHGSIYGDVIRRFPPFSDPEVPEKFLHKLVFDAAKKTYSINDIIIQEGKRGESMVFILEGACLLHSVTQKVALPRVSHGWWLGEKVIFWNEASAPIRTATCQAVLPCTTLEINRAAFLEAVEDFKLEGWLHRMQEKGAKGEPWGCPACGKDDHWFKDCREACLQGDIDEEDDMDIALALSGPQFTTADGIAVLSYGEVAYINFRRRQMRLSDVQSQAGMSHQSSKKSGRENAASPMRNPHKSRSFPLSQWGRLSMEGSEFEDQDNLPGKLEEVLSALHGVQAELTSLKDTARASQSSPIGRVTTRPSTREKEDKSDILIELVSTVEAMRMELGGLRQDQRAVEHRLNAFDDRMREGDHHVRSLLLNIPEVRGSPAPSGGLPSRTGYPVAQGLPVESSRGQQPCFLCGS